MAKLHLAVSMVRTRVYTGVTLPVLDAETVLSKTLTTSASSVATVIPPVMETSNSWLIATVTAVGGDVYVCFGTDPTAGVDHGYLVPSGGSLSLALNGAAKIAVKDV